MFEKIREKLSILKSSKDSTKIRLQGIATQNGIFMSTSFSEQKLSKSKLFEPSYMQDYYAQKLYTRRYDVAISAFCWIGCALIVIVAILLV